LSSTFARIKPSCGHGVPLSSRRLLLAPLTIAWPQHQRTSHTSSLGMAPPRRGARRTERLVWAALTAVPMALMSLASCVSYAHLLVEDTPVDGDFVAAASFFSSGAAVLATNMASLCPFTVSSPDMTIVLFLRNVVLSVSDADLPEEARVPTMCMSLHISSAMLGFVFFFLGKARTTVALNYLPYPVIAGFLAMVGAAVVKGAAGLMMPTPEQSMLPLAIGAAFASVSVVLKIAFRVPQNISSVMSIIILLVVFYAWAHLAGRSMNQLRQEGWLFEGPVAPTRPFDIWSIQWSAVYPWHAFPDFGSCTLLLVACINRVLVVSAVESAAAAAPYSIDDEMSRTGLATLSAGLVGGVAMNPSSGLTSLCKEGSRDDPQTARLAAAITALLELAVWAAGVPLTNFLPRFLLGGLLMMMGISMLVDWAWLVRQRIHWTGVVVIYGMLVFSLVQSLVLGVALGIVLALCLSNVRFAQLEVMKYHVSGTHFRSGETYTPAQRGILRKHGDKTQIVGLTGFVFEGVAIPLCKYLKEIIRTCPELHTLIIDCFACQGINDSACAHFKKVFQLCAGHRVKLFLCHLSPYDEELLETWGAKSNWSDIVGSLGKAISEAERRLLIEERDPRAEVSPKSSSGETERAALASWLGDEAADELLSVASGFIAVPAGHSLSDTGECAERVFVAIPGHSDVQLEVETGTSHRPALLSRTIHGAVCPAEALIGTQSRGTWRALSDSVGIWLEPTVLPSLHVSLPTLFEAGLRQQCQQMDQLSALYTVSRGGGWHGVTFDSSTRNGEAESFLHMPRRADRKDEHQFRVAAIMHTVSAEYLPVDRPSKELSNLELNRNTAREDLGMRWRANLHSKGRVPSAPYVPLGDLFPNTTQHQSPLTDLFNFDIGLDGFDSPGLSEIVEESLSAPTSFTTSPDRK